MRIGPPWFRPVSEPFGHFRLFVLLIVDLTRIQPNIQRSALFINRLVCLTWINLHRSVHELVFCQVLGSDRGVFEIYSPFLARLMAAMHAIRVVIGYVCAYVVVLWMATSGPALSHRARLFLYKDIKVFICGVRAFVSKVFSVSFTVHGLSFFLREVCGLLGETSPLFPLAWNVLEGGKKAMGEAPSTTFMLLKVGM